MLQQCQGDITIFCLKFWSAAFQPQPTHDLKKIPLWSTCPNRAYFMSTVTRLHACALTALRRDNERHLDECEQSSLNLIISSLGSSASQSHQCLNLQVKNKTKTLSNKPVLHWELVSLTRGCCKRQNYSLLTEGSTWSWVTPRRTILNGCFINGARQRRLSRQQPMLRRTLQSCSTDPPYRRPGW